jgi:hypothetical protein
MATRELLTIDPDVMTVARLVAREARSSFVIGWWIEGAERRLMLLPEGHHVTEEPPFLPVVLINPSGDAERLAA